MKTLIIQHQTSPRPYIIQHQARDYHIISASTPSRLIYRANMSVSVKVPLNITYTPSGEPMTVTVLGQILNNGQTNWVLRSGGALYIATDSADSASQTVLRGETYYLSRGPAVPAQATLSATDTAATSTAESGSTMSGARASSTPDMSGGEGNDGFNSISATTAVDSSLFSSSSAASGAFSRSTSAGRMAFVMGMVCLLGGVWA